MNVEEVTEVTEVTEVGIIVTPSAKEGKEFTICKVLCKLGYPVDTFNVTGHESAFNALGFLNEACMTGHCGLRYPELL